MKSCLRLGAILLLAGAPGQALGGGLPSCPPPEEGFLRRFAPVGGWFPYGGGLLRGWPAHCFPHCGTRDDYCRKQFPPVCRPPIHRSTSTAHRQGAATNRGLGSRLLKRRAGADAPCFCGNQGLTQE